MSRFFTYLSWFIILAVIVGAGWATVNGVSFSNLSSVSKIPYISSFVQPCSKPVDYKIGSIDPRFSESSTAFLAALQTSAKLWNTAAGKEVLRYAPDDATAMPVSLVYDTRQQTVTLGNKIDSTEADQNAERSNIVAAQAQYEAAGKSYQAAANSYSSESAAYKAEVDQINASGGADPQTYARLQAEKAHLQELQSQLTKQGDALTALGADLKAKIAAFNVSVRNLNSVVDVFNAKAGGDFEEGNYTKDASGARISIYAYKTQDELVHSIEHEFGHSIGLDHNDNPASIMYPYNKSGTALSTDDRAALKAACKL